MVLRAFAACLAITALQAEDRDLMPAWILPGILAVETSSRYEDGAIVWVNHMIGSHGERGAFQITERAFQDVRQPGETFGRLGRSPAFGEVIAIRILTMHYRATGSWERAVVRYHLGANGARFANLHAEGQRYLDAVRSAGFRYLEPIANN